MKNTAFEGGARLGHFRLHSKLKLFCHAFTQALKIIRKSRAEMTARERVLDITSINYYLDCQFPYL